MMPSDLAERIAGEITLSEKPGKTLRKWREGFSISQQDLADHLHQRPSQVADLESGRRKAPSVATIRKLVDALIALDAARGGEIAQRYAPAEHHQAIYTIREFPVGVAGRTFVESIEGEVVGCEERLDRPLYGYTVIDSLKAIMTLTAQDYLKVYGWSSERALLFTGVEFGRSPMVAVRSHPMKPGMVVFHQPKRIDPLAIRLAEIEGIPLVTTQLPLETLLSHLAAI